MKTANRLNWKPVVASLFHALASKGFIIDEINNGGDEGIDTPSMQQAVEETTACDEADVLFRHPAENKPFWCALVLGNDVCETVSDFTSRDTETGKLFEDTITAWSESMEGIPCPYEGDLFQGAFKDVFTSATELMDILRDMPKGPQHDAMVKLHTAIALATGNV